MRSAVHARLESAGLIVDGDLGSKRPVDAISLRVDLRYRARKTLVRQGIDRHLDRQAIMEDRLVQFRYIDDQVDAVSGAMMMLADSAAVVEESTLEMW